jgi:sugar lactone lactonase YvrE
MRNIWSIAALILILASQAGAQTINTVAGGGSIFLANNHLATQAEFNDPTAVAVDTNGNYYIADCNPSGGYGTVIYKVSSGFITIVAGTGGAGYTGDGGPATSATFSNQVNSIAVAPSGNIYISDAGYSVIRKVTVSTGVISTYAGYNPSKSLYFGGYNGDGQAATSAWLWAPSGIYLDTYNLYIVDAHNYRIRKVNSSGIISTIAGNGTQGGTGSTGNGGKATSAELANPTGIAEDISGNVYFVDNPTNGSASVVREINASTGNISQLPNLLLGKSYNLAADTSNNLYVINTFQILEYKLSTGKATAVAGGLSSGYSGDGGPATKALLNSPQGVAVDSSGNVYIADTGNDVIREF